MVVGQYLTQNATDAYELFEMLRGIKIEMRINPQVVMADNGYMNDNVIKYAYENNIRLLIPIGQKAANPSLKKMKTLMESQNSFMIGKQTHSSALKANICTTKTTEN